MARLTKLKLPTKKKGQLFLLEVFIALTVLVLLMVAIFQIELTSKPNYQDDLSTIGYDALDTINNAGELKTLVFNGLTSELSDSITDALPENILWRLSVEDEVGNVQFTLFWDRTPPADAAVGATDYFLYGYQSDINLYRVIHLELWRLVW
ncbi:MAG: hypothetical protein ACTSO7_08435 [Candidatus Heimdallarchaeota archaeon]